MPGLDWRAARFVVAVFWAVGTVAIVVAAPARDDQRPIVVTHWANGHVMTPRLLESFAAAFNREEHRVSSGRRIHIDGRTVNSSVIAEGLIARINPRVSSIECEATGCVNPRDLPDPIVVTPAADHWLSQLNAEIGRQVFDLANTQKLGTSWIGIATLDKMAGCLGWPNREVGYADILALRADPRGWESCGEAEARWGRKPLVAYTDPHSSSTGRSLLYGLFSIAANKPAAALAEDDLARGDVRAFIQRFQGSVDLYAPDTLILNRQAYAVPRSAHFFFIGEDNLVQLYEGKALQPQSSGPPRKLDSDQRLVMIYPKEGSVAHTHPAAIVQAPWVSAEEAEAARAWVDFLMQEPQQRTFLEEGFRPAANVPLGCPICPLYGLDAHPPAAVLDPNEISPQVRQSVARSWGEVRAPGVLVLVLDASSGMAASIEEARQSLIRVLDRIDQRTQVGLVTFADGVQREVAPAPLVENRFRVREAVERLQPRGGAQLYGGIKEATELADQASAEPGAVRGILVASSGRVTGGLALHELIQMESSVDGSAIRRCSGFAVDQVCQDELGASIRLSDATADELALGTTNRVHFFCIAVGGRVDVQIGRLLGSATQGSDCQAQPDAELNNVVNRFGRYF